MTPDETPAITAEMARELYRKHADLGLHLDALAYGQHDERSYEQVRSEVDIRMAVLASALGFTLVRKE